MLICYKGENVEVEILTDERETDVDMPLLVWFPQDHLCYEPDGLWIQADDFIIIAE